jgi:NAD(P)-dependent dehydrogenase (short-subunit alcohol dehydrogenase family)
MEKLKVGLVGYGLIGKTIYNHLTSIGHEVFIFDKNPIEEKNYIPLDITSEESAKSAIAALKKNNIKLSAVVNCSYPRTSSYGRKLEDVTIDTFNENVSVHLGGYFNVMKHFGFYFKEIGGGSVVSFSSVYGVVAPRFDIYENQTFTMPVEYSAIKAAVAHLTKYMASSFKGDDVRFNCISSGGVFDKHKKDFVEAYGKYSLSKRAGMLQPEDLVGAVHFLVSKDSRYVNGQNIVVDDGWTL